MYVMVPCWRGGALPSMLKWVSRAAFLAAAQRAELFTVVPGAPGVALVTFPYWSTYIVTTTVPDSCTLYAGLAITPTTLRPFTTAFGVPSVFPVRVLPWA